MSRVSVIYGFWIVLILLILAILVVSGVLWTDYKTEAWYYIIGAGLAMLYLGSLAMATSDGIGSLLNRMASIAAEKVGATD